MAKFILMLNKSTLLVRKVNEYRSLLYWYFRINRSGLFDKNWYLEKNLDVAQAKVNPLLHYLRYGGFEGRDPGPGFSNKWYMNTFEDAASAGINPLVYYLKFGQKKGHKLYFDDKTERVFCISMQRTGTTSVGKFFRDFGFRWAGWPADLKNSWSGSWHEGAYEDIFSSLDFRLANAFEDSPWFLPDFYKILFSRFPNSKFILFTRDPDAWFQSMVNHSGGNVIGTARSHCKIYRRELEYFDLLQSGAIDEKTENDPLSEKKMKITGHAEHYKEVYRLHNTEVQDFFKRHAPEALYVGRLEDPDKWVKLGKFLGVEIPQNYTCHENATRINVKNKNE